MNLKQIYGKHGIDALREIAKKADCSPQYLWQIATDRREPSPEMARRLVAADKRLKLADIFSQQATV